MSKRTCIAIVEIEADGERQDIASAETEWHDGAQEEEPWRRGQLPS